MNEQTSFLINSNPVYLAELYAKYVQDPTSVDSSWSKQFANMDDDLLNELQHASWALTADGAEQKQFIANLPSDPGRILDSLRALMLIRSYRVHGHLEAKLDPLGLEKRKPYPELNPEFHGFTVSDWNREIYVGNFFNQTELTLKELKDKLQKMYSGTIGVEYMHIQNAEQKAWLQERIEDYQARFKMSAEHKMEILHSLMRAEHFEKFLHVKFPGTKRFGLDGGESSIACLTAILHRAFDYKVEEIILGMSHRGRLNVLHNIIGKSAKAIFSEFQGTSPHPEGMQGSGDVKYHLGYSNIRKFGEGEISLSISANPSHLEAVDPVVLGKVRAKQAQGQEVFGLLMHGDAAFAGQGVVAETLTLAALPGYSVGGTIHLIINNQIGFTTNPKNARSSPYCSDVAKMIQAPIFLVNGDDVEAVAFVAKLALDFRQTFKKDAVIDLYCYRQYGHNEIDEPAFTQPIMYQAIAKQKSTLTKYSEKLINENVLTAEQYQKIAQDYDDELQADFKAAATFKPQKSDWLEAAWKGIEPNSHKQVDTGVKVSLLQAIGKAVTTYPADFNIHQRLDRNLKDKAEKVHRGKDIDWAMAEAMAFGSLLCEDYPVRLSGQDSGRGTFSQRHAVFHDQKTDATYIPLDHIQAKQAKFEVLDSPLSEMAVVGFEYGISQVDPYKLVLWEAQFGDFANGAQIMFDQFISAAQAKWLRMSGLVLLLPHGYEGQGPEHSSARLERWLQNSAEDNWQVANCTTPANYFHILRRQLIRNTRKPLIIMTPKSLLRHKLAVSSLKDMETGTSFLPVIGEINSNKSRVILCTGKVYYDLLARRMEDELCKVPIIRVEQLYPFPEKELAKHLEPYKNAEVIWCQEEPQNMGAWTFIDRRLEQVLVELNFKHPRPIYAGRPEAAATATGDHNAHVAQQKALVEAALGLG